MRRDARELGSDQQIAFEKQFQVGELVPGTSYRVTRCIGRGGMGSVYEVEHVELGRRFVLKALLRELAARRDLVMRLRNEWRALGRLEHANIVTVTDAGISGDGLPYYVMERLAGETLAQKLKRDTIVPVPQALHLALQLSSGLGAAHQIGIVHRDIKPSNLFLTEEGPLKLLDFGIAKLEDEKSTSMTAKGIAIGTPRYMAPEQARGDKVDSRADLYAVGLILFEMVTGQGPFDYAGSANALLLAQIHQEPPRLVDVLPGVARELSDLVERLLAKDPRDRPASVRQVVEALRSLSQRYASVVSTTQVTREATYDLSKVSEESLAGTRPDGVAARKAPALGVGEVLDRARPNEAETRTERGMAWTVVGQNDAAPTLRLDVGSLAEVRDVTRTQPTFDDIDPKTEPHTSLLEVTTAPITTPVLAPPSAQQDDVPTRTVVPLSASTDEPRPASPQRPTSGRQRASGHSSTPPPVERSRRAASRSPAERCRARLAWGLFAVGTSTCLLVMLLQGVRLWGDARPADPAASAGSDVARRKEPGVVAAAATNVDGETPAGPTARRRDPARPPAATPTAEVPEAGQARPDPAATRPAPNGPEQSKVVPAPGGRAARPRPESKPRARKPRTASSARTSAVSRIDEVQQPWPARESVEPEMPASGL